MNSYEMQKIAEMQAKYLVSAIKEDDELLDLIFPPKCMGIEEAAAFTSIPIGTIYSKIDEIPHTKVGKRLVFTDRGLMRWVSRAGIRPVKLVDISPEVQSRKVM
jgi:hypothetical protein